MSLTYPIQVGSLRTGSYIIINDFPCRITSYITNKPGKTGTSKAHITAVDIFTGQQIEIIYPTRTEVLAPFVLIKEYQLIDITNDGYLSLMTDNGDEKCDIKLTDNEIGLKLKKLFENEKESTIIVEIICAMGREQVVDFKVN
ncbi:hypothetical protein ABK040_001275 [Willaertia magna]